MDINETSSFYNKPSILLTAHPTHVIWAAGAYVSCQSATMVLVLVKLQETTSFNSADFHGTILYLNHGFKTDHNLQQSY